METEKPVEKQNEAGRPTDLTDELTFKIRTRVLEGKTYKAIREELNLVEETWDGWVWRDYKGFRQMLNEAENERMVRKAKQNLSDLLDMPVETAYTEENEDGTFEEYVKTEPALVKIKQDTSKFIAERLDKNNFALRTENTGKNGEPLEMNLSVQDKQKLDELLKDEPEEIKPEQESPPESDNGDTGGTEVSSQ